MLVVGIESSCDESAISVLEYDKQPNVLFELVSSQIDLHAQYGGVVPELAAREHLRNLPLLLDKTEKFLHKNKLKIDLIAATRGPGLKGCLLMGYQFAKAYAFAKNLPLIGINHIEAHLHACKLSYFSQTNNIYPFLGLIVSGGHTELVCAEDLGRYQIVARTQDDAAGEAFDKSANLLGFEYPGGAALARLADTVSNSSQYDFKLPKVMRGSDDFSFSGLKTAISLLVKKNRDLLSNNSEVKAAISHVVQDSIVDTLIFKTRQAAEKINPKFVTVTGGVACNLELRKRLNKELLCPVFIPEPRHCVDNASMIAMLAALRFEKYNISADPEAEVMARWPIEEI